MPLTNTNFPAIAAPLQRLALGVTTVRQDASPSTGYVSQCNCLADDAAQSSSMYTPPTYCFANEA